MMVPPRPVLLLPLACAILLTSCSGTRTLQAGMTRDEVSAALGSPLRVEKRPGGQETWYYGAVKRTRGTSWNQNYNRPGESVYERDLRIDTADGVASGVEFATTESYEEQALEFDSAGYLLNSPTLSILPSE